MNALENILSTDEATFSAFVSNATDADLATLSDVLADAADDCGIDQSHRAHFAHLALAEQGARLERKLETAA